MHILRSTKDFIINFARAKGYVVVSRWKLRDFIHATRLRELFVIHRIDHVIDVGANEGQFYRFLRDQVGFKGRIDSFEPIPHLCAKLQTLSQNDLSWIIHPMALGAEASTRRLNVMQGTDFSSFFKPLEGEAWAGRNVVSQEVEVKVSTLDVVFPNSSELKNTFLKLDTQGYDLEVVKGGITAVAAMPALQTEISFRQLYAGMPTYRDSLTFLESHGFVVADMIQVHDPIPIGGAYEFDLLMVRATAERLV